MEEGEEEGEEEEWTPEGVEGVEGLEAGGALLDCLAELALAAGLRAGKERVD